jgi:hypothetical protein
VGARLVAALLRLCSRATRAIDCAPGRAGQRVLGRGALPDFEFDEERLRRGSNKGR